MTLSRKLTLAAFFWTLTACGNSGHIHFASEISKPNGSAPFNMVLGSQALAQSGTGYTAKVQLAPMSGTTLQTAGEYKAKIHYTVRNR